MPLDCDPDSFEWTEFALVDTHIHLWDLSDSRLTYTYLEPDFVHPQLGDISALKRSFSVPGLPVGHRPGPVEAAVTSRRRSVPPTRTTRRVPSSRSWMRTRSRSVMVVNTDLTADDVDRQIERHTRPSGRAGGPRSVHGRLPLDPHYLRGCERLVAHGLHLEVEHWGDLSPVAALAKSLPELTVCWTTPVARRRSTRRFDRNGSERSRRSRRRRTPAARSPDSTWPMPNGPWIA